MARRTVKDAFTVEGVGIHTGTASRVTVYPTNTLPIAAKSAGIQFQKNGVYIPAQGQFVIDTSRCTVLGADGETVSTVEHLMSAFAGSGVTDALVEVIGSELPIGDGSAAFWTEAILAVGVKTLGQMKPKMPREETVYGKNGAFITSTVSEHFSLTVAISFEHSLVGTQIARYHEKHNTFAKDVAPARTFGFIEEVEALRKAGLALGGSEENAVVVYPDRYSSPLRFPNELARHKLLDLMGDLALAGLPLPNMEIFAVKPSHRLNVEFARALVGSIGQR